MPVVIHCNGFLKVALTPVLGVADSVAVISLVNYFTRSLMGRTPLRLQWDCYFQTQSASQDGLVRRTRSTRIGASPQPKIPKRRSKHRLCYSRLARLPAPAIGQVAEWLKKSEMWTRPDQGPQLSLTLGEIEFFSPTFRGVTFCLKR